MKKLLCLMTAVLLAVLAAVSAHAADGEVIYEGDAREFIFEPGSEYSPTDLFPNFKGVMPGDSLTQRITVRNGADRGVKVKIYMRSLGAHEDSADFLSKLGLRVAKVEDEGAYMFDAAANETAGLTDWVCLGTLYSGGEVDLDVILDVPVELDNEYSDRVGYLDWEFRIEEFPVKDDDPQPPQTGDDSQMGLWITLAAGSAVMLFILIVFIMKNQKDKEARTGKI